MSEKRAYERLALEGHVNIKTRGKNPLAFRAYLDNISFGGFAMFTREKLKPNRIVEFNLITHALDEGLVGRGKIRHLNQPPRYNIPLYTVGIEFAQVNKDLVRHIINRLQAKMVNEMQVKKQKAPELDFIAY